MIGDPAQAPLPRPSCFCMRIIFLTGIWPPDVGGPATHGPEFARFLVERGHEVTVVTMGDGEPDVRPCEVVVVSRASPSRSGTGASPPSRRNVRAAPTSSTRRATYAAASFASSVSRTPLVAKLVSDPAYERARRYGLFDGTLEEFQRPASRAGRGAQARADAGAAHGRARSSSRAPTSRDRAEAGGSTARGLRCSRTRRRRSRRRAVPQPPGTFMFVGRLTRQKALEVAIAADRARARRASSS